MINNKLLKPGQKTTYLNKIGTRHDGTYIGVPLMAIQGNYPGPVLGMATGLHGDTFEGPEALKQLFNEIDPNKLKGGIILTPHANINAFEVANRVGWIDYLDMNRSFPGQENGYVTEKLSLCLIENIIQQSDYFINFQGGGKNYDLHSYVGFFESEPNIKSSLEFAKIFGIPTLYKSVSFSNVLRLEAYKRKIPSLLVESGGEGRCNDLKVEQIKIGIMNVLNYLDMKSTQISNLPETYTLTRSPDDEKEFIHSPASGILKSYVQVGDYVKAGDIIGTISDVFGKVLETIRAPNEGMVLISRTIPSINIGEWICAIMKVEKTFNYSHKGV